MSSVEAVRSPAAAFWTSQRCYCVFMEDSEEERVPEMESGEDEGGKETWRNLFRSHLEDYLNTTVWKWGPKCGLRAAWWARSTAWPTKHHHLHTFCEGTKWCHQCSEAYTGGILSVFMSMFDTHSINIRGCEVNYEWQDGNTVWLWLKHQ